MQYRNIKILIIEDDYIVAENLKENLQEIGYEKIGIANGFQEAESLYIEFRPHLCIIDINLGENSPNGIDFVKKHEIDQHIPIIFLSSYSDIATREKVKDLQIGAFIVKPASKAQIDVSIELALENFHNHKSELEAPTSFLLSNEMIFLRVNDVYQKFKYEDIVYLKAEGSYTQIYTESSTVMISANIGRFLKALNTKNFIRCHRSYAINSLKIQAFNSDHLFVQQKSETIEIPIGNQFRSILLNHFARF